MVWISKLHVSINDNLYTSYFSDNWNSDRKKILCITINALDPAPFTMSNSAPIEAHRSLGFDHNMQNIFLWEEKCCVPTTGKCSKQLHLILKICHTSKDCNFDGWNSFRVGSAELQILFINVIVINYSINIDYICNEAPAYVQSQVEHKNKDRVYITSCVLSLMIMWCLLGVKVIGLLCSSLILQEQKRNQPLKPIIIVDNEKYSDIDDQLFN